MYLFIQASIYVSVDSRIFILFLGYNPLLLLFILFQLWELFQVGVHVLLTQAPVLVWGFWGFVFVWFCF